MTNGTLVFWVQSAAGPDGQNVTTHGMVVGTVNDTYTLVTPLGSAVSPVLMIATAALTAE